MSLKSLLLCVFAHNQSLISMLRSLQTCTSGIFQVNLSHHFPKIIFTSSPYFSLINLAVYSMLLQTDPS